MGDLLSTRDILGMRDTLRGVSNATLEEVWSASAPDRRGRAGKGSLLWSGTAAGFLERAEASHTDIVRGQGAMPAREELQHTDVFTILDSEGAYIAELAGPEWASSHVVIRDSRAAADVTVTARVVEMEHSAFGTLDSVVLKLDRAETST